MFQIIIKIVNLPLKTKCMAIKVLFLLNKYWLFSFILPFKYISSPLGRQGSENIKEISTDQKKFIIFLFKVFKGLSEYKIFRYKCLARALAAAEILRSQKIPYTVFFGIKKENTIMKAHSWIKSGQINVTGDIQGEFHVVSSFIRDDY